MIGKRILNYQIISLLGEGGMGSVYKAYDLQLERYVAIKIINPKLIKDPIFIERFRFEAKNQAKLNHPNLVTVYGFIETKDATGFVMEYVGGNTVGQMLQSYGRLDLIYSLRLLQQVLLAIDYAHSMGFIHRDLKPSNIIIDKNGIVKVMDFGISKSLNENQNITRFGSNIGTIYYMSPEQIKGFATTPRTDIYSLGITLYEMLSGNVPFNFKSDYEIYDAHLKMIPQKLSSLFQDIPKEVDELILSALNKSDKINFQTAVEFRNAIEHLIFNLPLILNAAVRAQNNFPQNFNKKNRSSNFIISLVIFLTIFIVGYSYYLIDKFVIKGKSFSSSEDKSKINYLTEKRFFTSSWERINTNLPGNITNIISFDSKLLISSSSGEILLSKNLGQSWVKLRVKLKGYITDFEEEGDRILATTSEGQLIIFDKNGKVIRSERLDDGILTTVSIGKNILICGSNGLILKSNKNNSSYERIYFPDKTTIFDIAELAIDNIFCCTWDGKVFYTTDSGMNWSSEKLINSYLKKIWFVNSFRGFLIGSEGALFKTTDGGLNWSKVNLGTEATLNDIIFINQKTGFILSSEGDVFISENSGDDWIKESIGEKLSLNKMINLSNGSVYIGCNNGILYKTKI
ncbi:protein kinase [Ignavibacterium sp.]|uniref:protein kinase domain-containing protein n=1 Tax=Ignavibacterium sp. TaxID=2651167 RepID=UPI00307EF5F1